MLRIRTYYGILAIFMILFVGTLAGSTVGYLQEGLPLKHNESIVEGIVDYYVKPFFWISFIGFIPTMISGVVIGSLIKRNSKN